MHLFIYNEKEDRVVIDNFNNNIYHISEIHYNANEKRVFFWSLLTLSNKTPDEIINTLPFVLTTKNSKKMKCTQPLRTKPQPQNA